jgi:Phage integrase family
VPKLTFPKRHKHTDVRAREPLTPTEVEKLRRRHGDRNAAMILLAYRHGLRVSELLTLRWDQLDLDPGLFHVRRVKNGVSSTHPLTGSEMRALRKLKRLAGESTYVFRSERKRPLTASSVRKMMAQAGERAELGFPVHPHPLRHGWGYKLAHDQQDTRALQLFLGHKHMQHTVKDTELAAERFKDFWRDEDSTPRCPADSEARAAPGVGAARTACRQRHGAVRRLMPPHRRRRASSAACRHRSRRQALHGRDARTVWVAPPRRLRHGTNPRMLPVSIAEPSPAERGASSWMG